MVCKSLVLPVQHVDQLLRLLGISMIFQLLAACAAAESVPCNHCNHWVVNVILLLMAEILHQLIW